MREILFRGQDAVTREWIYGCYVDNRDRGRCPPIIVPKNGNPHIYVVPETVGQFTGFTDKNGKKIFEGDVVLHQFGVGYSSKMYASFADGTQRKQTKTIVWNKIYCGYDFLSPPYDDEWLQDFEVIGNIHDQKEGK